MNVLSYILPVLTVRHWCKQMDDGNWGQNYSAPMVPPTNLRWISNEQLPLCINYFLHNDTDYLILAKNGWNGNTNTTNQKLIGVGL